MQTQVDVRIEIDDIISDIKTAVLEEELELREGESPQNDKIRDNWYIDKTLNTDLDYYDADNILDDDEVIRMVRERDLEDEIIDENSNENSNEYYDMDKTSLKRMLCRLVGVNYHTDNDTILMLLKEKL